jgi:thiamine biosynthesis lipoprotein
MKKTLKSNSGAASGRFPLRIPIKRSLVVVLIVALGGGCASFGGRPKSQDLQRNEYVRLLMGVRMRIVAYATDEPAAREAAGAAFERVAQLEDIMSDYETDSELMRLSRASGNGPQKVSPELFEVLSYGQMVSEASDGAFDVTVGPLVRLWRAARKSGVLPAGSALADARSKVGWRMMRLNARDRTIELMIPGMQLDLGGIAKGYAGDESIRVLREHGVRSALFEAGGDIVVSDPPPGTRGWQIELPGGRKKRLADAAISTSGDTVQFLELNGVRYSHVVDPRTGIGLTEHYAATVIAPRGITTDSLSTAATVLGKRDGESLIRRFGATGTVRKLTPKTAATESSTTSWRNP